MKRPSLLFIVGLLFFLTTECDKEDDLNSVTDLEGNVYKTVTIGTQVWLAENLKTTKLNDGTPLSNVTDSTAWSNLNTQGYCWYDNNEVKYKTTYGALYNWHTVNTNKLCPKGWHVPTFAEWDTLKVFLGGYNVAGDKMKEVGTTHWINTDIDVTNESGFTGLPAGIMMSRGTCRSICTDAYFWSSTEFDNDYAWVFRLVSYSGTLSSFHPLKTGGCSIRCIKD